MTVSPLARPPVADQAERERIVSELDRSLFVEAGAGTGKTAAVVSGIVSRVRAGRLRMERLVAITFTVAAAGELRVRIREALEEAARGPAGDAERRRLGQAASEVDRGRIETIHAFCSALLRMHPIEAGLPPDFDTLAELAADLDLRERFRIWFDSLVPGDPGAEAVRRGLLLGLRPDKLLRLFASLDANWDVVEKAGWSAERVEALGCAHRLGEDVQGCIDLLSRCLCAEDDELYRRVDSLREVAARLRGAGSEDRALAALMELERAPKMGHAGRLDNWRSAGGANACTTIRERMQSAVDEARTSLRAARSAALVAIAGELRSLVVTYADERRLRGAVTYHDLLVRARNLVRDHPDVAARLRDTWDFIAVDEFQDTDPLQAELAIRLAAAAAGSDVAWRKLTPLPGRLCLVGDPKQSIYRFRRADIALYSAVEASLAGADPGARVRLRVNFRSGHRIIDVVNAVFGGQGGLMRAETAPPGVQAAHAELVAHDPAFEGGVAIAGTAVAGAASEMWRREARATAAIVRRIRDEGWPVGEGKAQGPHPAGLDDICILMPSRTNLRNLERELEGAGVRYRLESGSLIIATQEVRDLLSILRCIDDPSDQVALVAALRSPAYGCSDVELARWRAAGGRWSYQFPGHATEPRVMAALADLRELNASQDGWSVPGLVDAVVSRRLLRALAQDGWRPQEALRRYRFVGDEARALARSGRGTLHDTVDHLERLAHDPTYDSVAQEPVTGDGSVRVMTVHAAKGLEFPIVIVTGLGRKPDTRRPAIVADHLSGHVELRVDGEFATPGWSALDEHEQDMEAAERVRLLYVAMTRPRDHLVVSLFRGERRGEETDAGRLDGLIRGQEGVRALDEAWEPVHEGRSGPEPELMTAEEHRAAEQAWIDRREALVTALGSLRTQTATGLAHAEAEEGLLPELAEDIARSRRGRAATSLGRAVHAVLQVVDLNTAGSLDALARAHAAAEGIPERAAEVASLAGAAWSSEPVRRAAGLRHWREVPLGAPVDGVLLEGFVDLLYELPDRRLAVVDYKTDAVRGAEVDRRMDRYRLQGGVYALLVAQLTGRSVARVEFVFAAAAEVRAVEDVDAVTAEVLRLLTAPAAGSWSEAR
ncbi:MAG TPA: UvrD-helicase domain-containing protein [Candidatus Binatia bacterium]|nr:UvrD-helicase domain-containing protein [Candidatus Binatia bacterium]